MSEDAGASGGDDTAGHGFGVGDSAGGSGGGRSAEGSGGGPIAGSGGGRPAGGGTGGRVSGPFPGRRPGDPTAAELAGELRALGRDIRLPDVDGETMAERVLTQLLADGVPTPAPARRAERLRTWARTRWRVLTAGLSGVLVVLVLTPPVRAEVADWFGFGFGGVEVRYHPSATPRPDAHTPWCESPISPAQPMSPAEAERQAGFRVRVPTALGEPAAVSTTPGPEGRRLVSLCWRERGRTIRLDQFPTKLDFAFVKQAGLMPEWVAVRAGEGLWFQDPHLLSYGMTDDRGGEWRQARRTAGPTLLWITTHDSAEDVGGAGGSGPEGGGDTTMRLEGVDSLSRALEIATSASAP
ncbi:hypothetical protein [Streptomyces sp. NPDC020965]|uniref:hypothetical protein n=1 Tax=Streptomyces sp. NPDC020965 TaxID=3365105 RepID=UPI0037AB7704